MRIGWQEYFGEHVSLSRRVLALVALAAVAFIVMSPALRNQFSNWDDPGLLTENYRVQQLSADRVVDFFRLNPHYALRPTLNLYIPLTLLSLACEHALWGLTPAPYFLSNILLNCANTVLVFLFLNRLTNRRGLAYLAALLFAVHPLHVESVAWLTERKDVLSGFFFLSSLWAYVVGEQKQWRGLYWASFALFVAAVLAKSVAVTLPIILVLIDLYLYRRLSWRMLVDKVRFFLVALCAGLVTLYLQHFYGSIKQELVADVASNVVLALRGIAFYVTHGLAPVHLCAIYPRPEQVAIHDFVYIGSALIVTSVVVVIVATWRKQSLIAFGFSFFIITLLPCIQLIPTGELIVAADRFFYLPSVGFFCALVAMLDEIWVRQSRLRFALTTIVAAYCVWLGIGTWQRTYVWRSSITLWHDIINQYPKCETALANLGSAYLDIDTNNAALYLMRADAINSNAPVTIYNLAVIDLRSGDTNRCLARLDQGISVGPLLGHQPYNFKATILDSLGRHREAITNLEFSLRLEPLNVQSRLMLARQYNRLGDITNENAVLNETIHFIPSHPSAYMALANIFEEQTNYIAALRTYARLVAALPNYDPGLYQYALSNQRLGKLDDARLSYERIVKRLPWLGVAWSNLGAINHLQGNAAKAREFTAKARELQPFSPEVQYNYACVQARDGKYEDALQALRMAVYRRAALREEARLDPDFSCMRAQPGFQTLIYGYTPAATDASAPR